MNTILKTSHNYGTITLVSDASVQNSKQSGFAWVITHKAMTLWKGVGVAPGPTDDIYSGRAKAFGLITSLTFLQHYVQSYKPTSFKATSLCCYCDNLCIINNITALLAPTIQRPNDTTADDWDVYITLQHLASECYPLRPQFIHVKGHQDKDPKHLITGVEQLYIECDHRAKIYTRETTIWSTTLGNPALPTAQPHLSINGKIICQKIQMALRQATTTPPIKSTYKINIIGLTVNSPASIGKFSQWLWLHSAKKTNDDSFYLSITSYLCVHQKCTHTMVHHSALHANVNRKTVNIFYDAHTMYEQQCLRPYIAP